MSVLSVALSLGLASASPQIELDRGDTITIVGNTSGERMQHFPFFEARLHEAYPDLDLRVRNLCWSGDEPELQPRPYKFAGMDAHVQRVGTDVLIACFGMNESFAGDEGVADFRVRLGAWLDHHLAMDTGDGPMQVVLVSPVAHEDIGGRLPDGVERTFVIARYVDAMRREALERGVPFIDLHRPMRAAMAGDDDLTINGIHLNATGHDLAADEMLVQLGLDGGGIEPGQDMIDAIRRKNRYVFERFRPTNTEYVYGRRHEPFGDDNFPTEMEQLETLAVWADGRIHARDWDAVVPEPVHVVIEHGQEISDDPSKSAENRPVPPADVQVERFELPDGWSVSCWASEEDFPELSNPIAMNWDGYGRLWVVVAPTYPHVLPGQEPADKLIVLEDTDADGKADRSTVFADGLYVPTGFATAEDEAWVVSQPNLLHLRDNDGDLVADERRIVLHGFGAEDSHHAMSAFHRPPDGSIYFQEGTFHHTQIETPHGPMRASNAGVFRYDPDTEEVECVASWPFANPWGHVADHWGRSIIEDASPGLSRRLTHISGAHAYPDQGKYENDVRGVPSFTPGGRRPAGGIEIIGGAHIPEKARGRLLITQSIGFHGIRWYDLFEEQSGFRAGTLDPELIRSTDPTCRPVDVEVGPDGAIYMLDWANPIVGHMQFNVRDPRRDHSHGRVWRITADGRPLHDSPEIPDLDNIALFGLLEGDDPFQTRRARLELGDRPADEVLPEALAWASASDDDHDHLEALWLHQAHGAVNESLLDRVIEADDPRARAAAMSVIKAWRGDIEPFDRLKSGVLDTDPRVRVEALLTLGYIPDPRSVELVSLAMRQPIDRGTQAVLARALAALADHGTPGGEGTQAWRLARLEDAALSGEPMDHFVAAETLARGSLDRQERLEAARWLAERSNRDVAAELIATAEQRDNPEATLDLLVSLDASELAPVRPQLELVIDDPTALESLRYAAWASVVRLDGFDSAWSRAMSQPGLTARMDLLEAIGRWPDLADEDVRAVLMQWLAEVPDATDGPVDGRFVRVELDGPATLTLAEVEVVSDGENIALGKNASQSTTRWDGVAGNAVDGNTAGAWTKGTSTHTSEGQPDPWWEVDLGAQHRIDGVSLHNRTDTPLHLRLDGYRLIVLDEDRNVVWESQGNPAPAFVASHVPGGDPESPLHLVAMSTLASAWPDADTLAALAPWVRTGHDAYQMPAVLAMNAIPEDAWSDELADCRMHRQVIRTIPDKMAYDPRRFDVLAGQPVEIRLVNPDTMPHNLIVIKPGMLRKVGRASDAQGAEGDAAARDYVPDVSGLLHIGPLVMQGDEGVMRFMAPERPGRYPFVCTYPAHWQMMNGVMTVKRP